MTAKTWPDPAVPYDYPSRTPANETRWKDAITEALRNESLRLEPTGTDVFDLVGKCPRCGHKMTQSLEFEIVLAVSGMSGKSGTFNIDCDCREPHTGRDDKHKGCGWGGPIELRLHVR